MKIGDWVKFISNKPNDYCDGEILQITNIDDRGFCHFGDYNKLYSIDLLELWYPKEGEWCWFDKNKLGKFWKKQGTRNYWTLSDFISISEKTKIPSGDYFVSDYCEPFIGQLPSFIKDK